MVAFIYCGGNAYLEVNESFCICIYFFLFSPVSPSLLSFLLFCLCYTHIQPSGHYVWCFLTLPPRKKERKDDSRVVLFLPACECSSLVAGRRGEGGWQWHSNSWPHVTCWHRPYLTYGQEHLAAWPLSSEWVVVALYAAASYSLNPNEPASANRTKERREKPDISCNCLHPKKKFSLELVCYLLTHVTLFLKEICPMRIADFPIQI